jgi:serine/threonine protein kinase
MTNRVSQQRLDVLAMQYLAAIDGGDFDAIEALWDRAEEDPDIGELFHGLHAELMHEQDASENARIDQAVLEMLQKHLPSGEIVQPAQDVLAVRDVAEYVLKNLSAGLSAHDVILNDMLLSVAEEVPADLAISKIVQWGQRFGNASATYWRSFRQAALKLRMKREAHVNYQMAARPTKAKRTEDKATWLETLPEEFGRYRILKLLGQGGMGAVYLAHDTQLGRDVALKVPNFDPKRGQILNERFDQEARAAATVQHPNICPIFDVGVIDGIRYLTMAYIDGRPLRDWMGGGKPLSTRQIANLCRKVALALHEAHQRGVVHRDLKPPNIMIDRRGEPMIMDFGLARRFREDDPRLTRIGSTMGTPAYMAPEQCSGDRNAMGPSCDIYSLGVILYELIAGRLPFVGDDAMAVLSKVLIEAPAPPSAFRDGLEPELERICLKAMAKKPEDRYETAGAMAAALGVFIKSSSPNATTSAPVVPILLDEPETAVKAAGRNAPYVAGPRTMPRIAEQADTDTKTDLDEPRRPPAPRKRRSSHAVPNWVWGVILGGVGLIIVVVLIGAFVVYRTTNYGTRRIDLSEPNAAVTVRVDGSEVDIKGGVPLRLRPGEHELDVAGKEYEPLHLPFTVERGENPPLPVPLQVKLGSVRIELSEPNAVVDVLVNGQRGHRHGETLRLPPRQQHQFVVTGQGYKPWAGHVTLQPGQVFTLSVPLERQGQIDVKQPPIAGKLPPLICVNMDNLDKVVEVWQISADGANAIPITKLGKICASPTYSPDGMRIAFAANVINDKRLDLYRMDADGRNVVQLTNGPGSCAYPSWSPLGDRIAIEHRLNNNADIWVIDAGAKQGINLTPSQGLNYSPAWSPDGQEIAFASNRKGKDAWGIYLMRPDGLNPREIKHIGRPNRPVFNPAWSPDSSKIVFSAPKGPKATELYVIDRTGKIQTQLTNLGGINVSPAWSSDGSTIAFEHSTEAGGGLWLINADGTNPREIVANRYGGRPCWKPR